jgi:hypothetical protein
MKLTIKKVVQGFLGSLRMSDLPVDVLDSVAKSCGVEGQDKLDEVTRDFVHWAGSKHGAVQNEADLALQYKHGLRLTFCEREFSWDQQRADQKELEQLRDFRKQVWAEKVRRNPDCAVTRECAEAAGLKVRYEATTGKVSIRKNGKATPLPEWEEVCSKRAGRDLSKSAISVIA